MSYRVEARASERTLWRPLGQYDDVVSAVQAAIGHMRDYPDGACRLIGRKDELIGVFEPGLVSAIRPSGTAGHGRSGPDSGSSGSADTS